MPPDANDMILNLQSLYRGWFVRRFMKTCFYEFQKFCEEIGDDFGLGQTGFVKSFEEQVSVSKPNEIRENDVESDATKAVVTDSSDELSADLNMHSSTSKFEKKVSHQISKTALLSEELKEKLYSLNEEKLWLENAILARIEYLTNF